MILRSARHTVPRLVMLAYDGGPHLRDAEILPNLIRNDVRHGRQVHFTARTPRDRR